MKRIALLVGLLGLVAPLWMPAAALLFSASRAVPIETFTSKGSPRDLSAIVTAFQNPNIQNALVESLMIALLTGVVGSFLGWLAAWSAADSVSPLTMQLFAGSLFLPLLLPANCLSIGLMDSFRWLGVDKGILTIVFSHTLMYLGIAFVFHLIRLQQLPRQVILAAENLGASRGQIFRQILLRHQTPAFLSSSLVVGALSFNEPVVASYVGGTIHPLAVQVLHMLSSSFDNQLYAAGAVIFVVSSMILVSGCVIQYRLVRTGGNI